MPNPAQDLKSVWQAVFWVIRGTEQIQLFLLNLLFCRATNERMMPLWVSPPSLSLKASPEVMCEKENVLSEKRRTENKQKNTKKCHCFLIPHSSNTGSASWGIRSEHSLGLLKVQPYFHFTRLRYERLRYRTLFCSVDSRLEIETQPSRIYIIW